MLVICDNMATNDLIWKLTQEISEEDMSSKNTCIFKSIDKNFSVMNLKFPLPYSSLYGPPNNPLQMTDNDWKDIKALFGSNFVNYLMNIEEQLYAVTLQDQQDSD